MKADYSRVLLGKYIRSQNKRVTVFLQNRRVMKGVIVGFFKGCRASNEPYVTRWHLVDNRDKMTLGWDAFGNRIGTLINQKDIVEIEFEENKTITKG